MGISSILLNYKITESLSAVQNAIMDLRLSDEVDSKRLLNAELPSNSKLLYYISKYSERCEQTTSISFTEVFEWLKVTERLLTNEYSDSLA